MITRNKKKLRRQARLLSGSFAGKTLLTVAMVGMLAAPAMATVTKEGGEFSDAESIASRIDLDKDVTFTFKNNLTVTGSTAGKFHGINGWKEGTGYLGTVNITTGTNPITAGGAIGVKTVNITGGTTNISGKMAATGPGNAAWRAGSQIYAGQNMTIAGESAVVVNLADNGLIGVGDSDTPGGKLIIGKNATVNMTSVTSSAASAAVMHIYGDATLEIKDGGKLNVASIAIGAIGSSNTIISGKDSQLIVAGALEMVAKLPNAEDAATANTTAGLLFSSGNLTVKDGARVVTDTATFTSGTLTVDGTALQTGVTSALVRSGIYKSDSTVADTISLGDSTNNASALTVNVLNGGGLEATTITVDKNVTLNINGTAATHVADLAGWRQGSLVMADNSLTIATGSKVNVRDYGVLGVATDTSTSPSMTIAGTVNVGGSSIEKAAALVATSDAMVSSSAVNAGLSIGTGGVVNVDGYARMMGGVKTSDTSPALEVDGGKLNVMKGGHLLVADGYKSGDSVAHKKDPLAGTFNDAYALQIYNTTLTVGSADPSELYVDGNALLTNSATANGILDILAKGKATVTGDMLIDGTWDTKPSDTGKNGGVKIAAGGALTVNGNLDITKGSINFVAKTSELVVGKTLTMRAPVYNPTTKTRTFTLSTGDITLGGLNLVKLENDDPTDKFELVIANSNADLTFTGLANDAAFFKVNGAAATAANSSIAVSAGALNFNGANGGSYAGMTTVSDSGALTVASGNWTLGTLDVKAGHADITGGKLTIGTALKSAAAGDGSTTGINVKTGGVLSGNSSIFLKDVTATGATIQDNLNKIALDSASTLEMAFAAGTTLDKAQRDAIHGALLASDHDKGLISYNGATLVFTKQTTEGLTDTVSLDDATGVLAKGETVGVVGTVTSGVAATDLKATFGADKLAVKADSATTEATVTIGHHTAGADVAVTLIGEKGTLVNVRNADGSTNAKASANVAVVVSEASTLNLGNSAANAGSGSLAKVTAANANLNVVNGNFNIGSLDLVTGSNSGAKVNLGAGGALTLGELKAGTSDTIAVGNASGAGTLIVEKADLKGASVFLDPAWKGNDQITDASKMVVGGSSVNGLYTVGQNSWVAMGTTNVNWLPSVFANSGLIWGANNVTAALGIYAPQTLVNNLGGIKVDGTLTTANVTGNYAVKDNAVFAANSLLVVNAAGLNGSAAITGGLGTGTATVADSSKLLLVDGTVGNSYTILDGFKNASSAITGNGWKGDNLLSSSYLQTLQLTDALNATDGKVSVTVGQKSAQGTLPGISGGMAGLVDSLYAQGLNKVDSPNAGVAFVSRATDRNFININDSARVLESAAQMALAGGAPVAAFDAVAASGSAMAERTGISMPAVSRGAGISSGDAGHSFGLWATPLYRSSEISKQKAGSFKYSVDSDLFGGIIGADVTNPLMGGDLRFGAALNVGGGDAKSKGGLAKTKNDFDFWGASIYAGYRLNNFGLSADLGYTSTSSDIKQDLLPSLNMGSQLKSKVDSDTYTVGLKAEYVINTAMVDITPSVGMRYTAYRQGRYNAESQFGTVFNMDKSEMNTWTFPVGVKFSRDLDLSGWKMTPELNLAVIPATGDTKLKSKAHLPGMSVSPASMTGHVFDSFTGEAGVGVKLAKDNLSFGLNYDFQGGSHVKAHNVFGSFRYTF